MTRGVLFDLDGVIVDSKRAWYAALNSLRREMGLGDVSPEAFDAAWGQSTADDARTFFDDRLSPAELGRRYEARFSAHLGEIQPEPAAKAVIARLRQDGLRIGLTTNAPSPTARAMLSVAGLADAFQVVVTADDVLHPKPDPEMLLSACRRLGISPQRAVLVGDTESDAAAGAAAGIPVVGYRADISGWRVEDLTELPSLLARLDTG